MSYREAIETYERIDRRADLTAVRERWSAKQGRLHVYVHSPFCASICRFGYYTGVEFQATENADLCPRYYDAYLPAAVASKTFEVHPVVWQEEQIDVLAKHRFNCSSIGVQSFDAEVRERQRRLHAPFEKVQELAQGIRARGMHPDADVISLQLNDDDVDRDHHTDAFFEHVFQSGLARDHRCWEGDDEITAWPETPGRWMRYYETTPGVPDGRGLCRIENFHPYHSGVAEWIGSEEIQALLEAVLGEPAVLHKDKINFKLGGCAGFAPHQDAPAYAAFGQTHHVSMMVPVDPMTPENGCLEIAAGERCREILAQRPDGTLDDALVARTSWQPLRAEPGDLLLFDSLVPHRSGPNRSAAPRRAFYLTFNGVSQGDHRQDYFAHKRRVFPPEIERGPEWVAPEGARDYNLGNPIR